MSEPENPLFRILNPRSICVMGASNQTRRMGNWVLLNILTSGYQGRVYVVHPSDKNVQGVKAYPNIDSLPEAPELLVLVIPTTIVPEVLEYAGRKGTRRAIIITAGYNEIGEEGRNLQKKIDDVVKRHNIKYLGPNCLGLVNWRLKINTTTIPFDGRAGGIGLASHSGSYISQILPLAEDMDMGIGELISLGNEGSLDIADALDYFYTRSEIKVVGLYLEGIRRPAAFRKAAIRLAKKKPIVAIYSGGTPEGAHSAASHTAAISASGEIMRGFLRQCGVLQTQTSNELYEWLNVFDRQPLPKGPRVAILSNSGGPSTTMADSVGRSELELSHFSQETSSQIKELMPHTASHQNPIDVTFTRDPAIYSYKLPRILGQADEIDGILVYGVFGSSHWKQFLLRGEDRIPPMAKNQLSEVSDYMGETMSKAFEDCGKPVIGASFNLRRDSSVRQMMEKGNIPFYNGPERAVRAMEALWRYKKIKDKIHDQ